MGGRKGRELKGESEMINESQKDSVRYGYAVVWEMYSTLQYFPVSDQLPRREGDLHQLLQRLVSHPEHLEPYALLAPLLPLLPESRNHSHQLLPHTVDQAVRL